MEEITCPNTIAILMATYNGEKYLGEQIDSILAQTCQDWHLYIHDDGSRDNTVPILKQYATGYSEKITILDYPSQGGACYNFLSMLQQVDAKYYMFCDQDDVWLKDKVTVSLDYMKRAEEQHQGKPIIVFTDLAVTDESLKIINPSFWQEICLYPDFITDFDHLAASTAVTGCAMLFNQLAKDTIVFPATYATMHDAWITACVLKNGGVIQPIKQQMVYYRQHEANCIGATDLNHITLAYRIKNIKEMQRKNWQLYRMLSYLGYGSICKFFRYKFKYREYIKKQKGLQ